jgi:hypothetical protein
VGGLNPLCEVDRQLFLFTFDFITVWVTRDSAISSKLDFHVFLRYQTRARGAFKIDARIMMYFIWLIRMKLQQA